MSSHDSECLPLKEHASVKCVECSHFSCVSLCSLRQVLSSAQKEKGDLTSQLTAANQTALQSQQKAEQALKESVQAAAQAADHAAGKLAAQEQQSAQQLAAMQQLVQQLQQQLQDAVGQVMERSATVLRLQDRVGQLEGVQQQLDQFKAAADAGQVELHAVKTQNQLLALQAGLRWVSTALTTPMGT